MSFVHLHLHTEYSLLDGANKIGALSKRLKELGMNACGITDHGNMFGAIDFYKSLKKEGIQPIIGLEAYLHNGEMLGDKTTKQRFHLCLFAKNEIGYKNLMKLSSLSYIEGYYYYPRINKKLLEEYSEGIVATSACLQGEINWNLNPTKHKDIDTETLYARSREVALWYKKIFGDDFYLEIMRHGISDQQRIDAPVLRLAKELNLKIIATNDTHYQRPEDAEPHEAFMCISTGKQFDDPNRLRHSVHEFYLKSPDEMAMLYADIPEALTNTVEIAQKCTFDLKLGSPTPPTFKFTAEYSARDGVPTHEDSEYFAYKCREGLQQRLEVLNPSDPERYKERLEIEINVINSMKFPGYMLIVWDYINFARQEKIPVGPGRGSAAGSLVAYALGITDIDPLPYNLLFERFLNPERISMPDIDTDFCQARRGEVIDYIVGRYGRYNVAQVITFGSLLAKGVIRDVTRVLGFPYAKGDELAKLIPEQLGITLDKAIEQEEKIKSAVENDPDTAKIWRFALALEGLKRNAGTHAAGIVISNEELWHKTPLYKPSNADDIVTQYDGRFLEDVDLIKFDFLGLKTLTVIDDAVRLIEKNYGITVDISNLNMYDKEVYDLIQTGDTLGLFQIESSGMQRLVNRLKPTNFEDIIAVLALYRPGPMESGMLDDFIERKHGRQEVEYMFPALEEILAPTYGVIVYQEQVMQIVQTIGGFSLGGADIIRRAMGKKQIDYMKQKKAEFAEGAAKQGLNPQKAEELFDLIEKFAGYGFNKSHSAAYAMITYQTAWLKTHYKTEFMAALLTSERDNTDKIVKYIEEVKNLGIAVLAPDINESDSNFTPVRGENPAIRFGLGAIKGVGESALELLLQTRCQEGAFSNFHNFLERVDSQKANKKVLEALTKSGAFDCFGYSRRTLLSNIETIVSAMQDAGRAKKESENSLFGDDSEIASVRLELTNMPEYEMKTILEGEKESLGFFVSGHPLDAYTQEMKKIAYTLSSDLDQVADRSEVLLVGKIEELKTKLSKSGSKFTIATILDLHGTLELTLFEKTAKALEELDTNEPIVFKAGITKDGDFTKIRVFKAMSLADAAKEKVETKIIEIVEPPLTLKISITEDAKLLEALHNLICSHIGKRELKIILSSKLGDVEIESRLNVNSSLIDALSIFEGRVSAA